MKKLALLLFNIIILIFMLTSGLSDFNDAYDKIIFEFDESISMKIEDITTESFDELTQKQSSYDIVLLMDYKENSVNRRELLETGVDPDVILRELRSNSKQFHISQKEEIVKEINKEKFVIDVISSDYSPFITIVTDETNMSNLEKIAVDYAMNESVDSVFVRETNKIDNTSKTTDVTPLVDEIDIDFVQTNYPGLTGDGVKIGILDGGIIDEDDGNFDDLTYTPVIRNVWFYTETVSWHSTTVAAIAAGNDGVAPDARIYSVELNQSNGFSSEIDYLIGKGVHIINMSVGDQGICDSTGSSDYDSNNLYLSYIVRYQAVTMVAATGNELPFESGGYICSPANADNVISVGAVRNNGDVAAFSNYLRRSGTEKSNPLIVAPSELEIDYFGTLIDTEGTSWSTPLVSGSIALMMEDNPSLKILPDAVFARVAASANPDIVGSSSSVYTVPDTDWLDMYYTQILPNIGDYDGTWVSHSNTTDSWTNMKKRTGAGMLDLNKVFGSDYEYHNGLCVTTSNTGQIMYKYIDLDVGDDITIALAFLRNGSSSSSDPDSKYIVKLYDENGVLIDQGYSSLSNVQIIDYTVPYGGDGTYKIVIWKSTTTIYDDDYVSFHVIVE